ncbi:hypothetical protein ACIVBQ_000545 [Tenacibaculum discolor]
MKKIILPTIVVLGVYGLFKLNKMKNAIDSLKVKLTSVKNIDISWSSLKFNFDLLITNPTMQNIGFNTYDLVKLSKVEFYNKTNNSFLGTASLNLSSLELNANSSVSINNVLASFSTKSLIKNIDVFKQDPLKNLDIYLVLSSAGKTYKIKA